MVFPHTVARSGQFCCSENTMEKSHLGASSNIAHDKKIVQLCDLLNFAHLYVYMFEPYCSPAAPTTCLAHIFRLVRREVPNTPTETSTIKALGHCQPYYISNSFDGMRGKSFHFPFPSNQLCYCVLLRKC